MIINSSSETEKTSKFTREPIIKVGEIVSGLKVSSMSSGFGDRYFEDITNDYFYSEKVDNYLIHFLLYNNPVKLQKINNIKDTEKVSYKVISPFNRAEFYFVHKPGIKFKIVEISYRDIKASEFYSIQGVSFKQLNGTLLNERDLTIDLKVNHPTPIQESRDIVFTKIDLF